MLYDRGTAESLCQPRHNVMISSEWGSPSTVSQGFDPKDVAAGKYGKQLHFWNWKDRKIEQTIDLGETGLITESGGMKLNEEFMVDFGAEPGGPVRAHEIRFPAYLFGRNLLFGATPRLIG